MTKITESTIIHGVKFALLKPYVDERGQFLETFRKGWFPERSWQVIQTNRSDSSVGVLRGLHYHHQQVDYWYVPHGTIRVGLADLRLNSPTLGACETIEIGYQNQMGLLIPPGVAHGFLALTDATLTYIVDNYYDNSDEHGVAWNDPTLSIGWDIELPRLSQRDLQNPFLVNIPLEKRPKFL